MKLAHSANLIFVSHANPTAYHGQNIQRNQVFYPVLIQLQGFSSTILEIKVNCLRVPLQRKTYIKQEFLILVFSFYPKVLYICK